MRRIALFLAMVWNVTAGPRYTIDRIEAVIFGAETTDLVTKSDIERLGFDGSKKSKDDIILERLMFQDALRYRVMIDEKTIDDYLEKMRKQHNATMEDIKEMFHQAGYTYEEGRRQLGMTQAINQVIDHKASNVLIPESEVVAYYEKNPQYRSAFYRFERASIPDFEGDEQTITEKFEKYKATGRGLIVSWRMLPDVAETDLDESMRFLTSLKVDEISKLRKIKGGYDVFRLKWKQKEVSVPLEERYRTIVEILRKPKFDELIDEYKKELLKDPPILYL